MHGVLRGQPSVASEIQGQFRQGTDRIVSRKFGAVARVIWPSKTAWHVAAVANISERHAARILAGEFEAPAALLAAVILEITRT